MDEYSICTLMKRKDREMEKWSDYLQWKSSMNKADFIQRVANSYKHKMAQFPQRMNEQPSEWMNEYWANV